MRLPFPPRIPLKILLAGLAGLALLHVAIVEGLQGGACVACRWCMDCGAAYRETRCDLFGLVPLTRSTRIEPGPIAAFLERRYGFRCTMHVFGGALTEC